MQSGEFNAQKGALSTIARQTYMIYNILHMKIAVTPGRFLGRFEGYPFLNPFIPVIKYKLFAYLYSFLCCFSFSQPAVFVPKDCKIFYLKPVHKIGKKVNACTVAQEIYHELCKLELQVALRFSWIVDGFATTKSILHESHSHLDNVIF